MVYAVVVGSARRQEWQRQERWQVAGGMVEGREKGWQWWWQVAEGMVGSGGDVVGGRQGKVQCIGRGTREGEE